MLNGPRLLTRFVPALYLLLAAFTVSRRASMGRLLARPARCRS